MVALTDQLRRVGWQQIGLVAFSDSDDWRHCGSTDRAFTISAIRPAEVWRDLLRFASIASKYESLFIVGTDILDGAYSVWHSVFTLQLARVGQAAGAHTSVISFSVNDGLTPRILEAFRDLPQAVRLVSRDPVSNRRLAAHLHRAVVLSADVAFLLQPAEATPSVETVTQWGRNEKTSGRTVVGLAVSSEWLKPLYGLTTERVIAECARLISGLTRGPTAVSVALVAHDPRGDPSDRDLAGMILEALPAEVRLHCLNVPPCNAREMKGICSALDAALSGRMHFAIACLGQGVPVACVTYQDKFQGLFEHFGLDGMTVEIREAFLEDKLTSLAEGLIRRSPDLRRQIAERLDSVLRLALVNVPSPS